MKKSTITDLPNDIRKAVPHSERSPYVKEIIKQAQRGEFHDFKNNLYVCGKMQLVHMLHEAKEPALLPIRQAVINGEYDESPDDEDNLDMNNWLKNVYLEQEESPWNTLNEEQKIKFQEYCDNKYGKTIIFCETGEPMYMDEESNLIDTAIIIDLLFSSSKN